MRKCTLLAIISLMIGTFIYAGDPPEINISKEFPKTNTESDIKAFLDKVFNNSLFCNDVFQYIQETKKSDFIIPFVQTFKKYYPDKYYRLPSGGYWTNPINAAIFLNRIDIVKSLIQIDAMLVSKNDTGGQFDGVEPMSYAVKANDFTLCDLLIPYIKDINNVVAFGTHGFIEKDLSEQNLLTLSTTSEMDKYLLSKGIKEIFDLEKPIQSFITDDHVNIRSGPSREATVITQLNTNNKIELLQYTAKRFVIDNYKGSWVKIRFGKDKYGWVFEKYVHQYER